MYGASAARQGLESILGTRHHLKHAYDIQTH